MIPIRLRPHRPLAVILAGSALLRLLFLDYSHFQGDEVKALYPPGAPFPAFLLAQKKGPVQFLVTFVVERLSGGLREWQMRLPFALASIVAVVVVYGLVFRSFGRRAALLAAALVGSCGLFVAFGRIVQYQSLCILFVTLTALCLTEIRERRALRLVYLAAFAYATALLCHYDALTFAPAAAFLVFSADSSAGTTKRRFRRHLLAAVILGALLVAAFYVPFAMQPHFGEVVRYLGRRVSSGNPLRTLVHTERLLALYLPPLSLPVLALAAGCGVAAALRRGDVVGRAVVCWFAGTFAFYVLPGGRPRSHVYNYLLPGLLLSAIGIDAALERVRKREWRYALETATWLAIAGFAGATYWMVVDHSVEHPWYRKNLLGFELPNLVDRRIDGVFGFPYRRGLDEVGRLFRSGELHGSFASNERDVMADHYFRAARSTKPDVYVHVLHPLSLETRLPDEVRRDLRLDRTIVIDGRPTIEIYVRDRGRRSTRNE